MTTEKTVMGFQEAYIHLCRLAVKGNLSRVITVSGPTCSGKSTWSQRACEALNGVTDFAAVVLPLDDYFKDADDPTLPRDRFGGIFDLPDSFFQDEFRHDLEGLLSGIAIQVPVYSIIENRRLHKRRLIGPTHGVIAEGLFAGTLLNDASQKPLHVYMDAAEATCLTRRIKRGAELKVPPEVVEKIFRKKILPYWHLFEKEKEIADIIVRSE